MSDRLGPLAGALCARAGDAMPVDRVAEAVVGVLREIDHALQPVIGPRGVAALLLRSVHLAAQEHPWLADVEVRDGREAALDLQRLTHALSIRGREETCAAGAGILDAFHRLLTSLLGDALCRRLVGDLWTELLGDVPVREPTP